MGIRLQELIVPFKADTSGFAKAVTGGVLATVAAVGTAMVTAFVATEKWANELDSLGDVMGGTKEQLAAYAYTARVSKVGTEAFTKANIFLEKSLVKSNGRLDVGGKALKQYGINVKDVNGKVKDQATLTQEIADKYGKLATQQEKVNFLTEIYGKQGAQLIDFFDVLNGEGGVDALSKKMKDLGLAIDPARYENFNRNIERLKMLGLALAVAFTEKVMPVLEKTLDWFIRIKDNPKVQSFLDNAKQNIDDFINSPAVQAFIKFLDDKFGNNSTANVPAWAQPISADALNPTGKTDWFKVGDDIGDKIMEGLDLINKGGLAFDRWISSMEQKIDAIDWGAVTENIYNLLNGLSGGTLGILYGMFANWISTAQNKLSEFQISVVLSLSTLMTTITKKLYEIDTKFTEIAGGWIVNAWGALKLRLGGFYTFLTNMVTTINGILSRINSLSISLPDLGGGSTKSGATGGGGGNKKRASGGAVTAGQAYNVAEFNKTETFIPAVNGRIVNGKAESNQPVQAYVDEKALARVLRTEMQKIMATS